MLLLSLSAVYASYYRPLKWRGDEAHWRQVELLGAGSQVKNRAAQLLENSCFQIRDPVAN